MKGRILSVALLLALSVGISAAAAQSGILETKLQLSPDQRGLIYKNLAAVPAPDAKTAIAGPGQNLVVGAELPSVIETHEMPEETVSRIPAVKAYKYALVQRDVVIVEPATRQIVEIIAPQ